MQTVVETLAFLGDARSLGLSDAERLAIVTWVAANPAAGEVIAGTGGARKVFKNVLSDMVKTYRPTRKFR